MRFPFSLTRALTAYLLGKRLAGQKRYPLVLMLEPSHACNLSCKGCGRIREYADTLGQVLSPAQCLAAVEECGAPIVSVCGGEPLVYPHLDELLAELLARRKHVYLCTNGVLLARRVESLRPSPRLMINVHLDGMEATHDRLADRPGVFAAAAGGIVAAKRKGFYVCTNTTIYRETDLDEIAVLFDYLAELGVEAMLIAPAYGYQAVVAAHGQTADELFMTRRQVHEKFRQAERLLGRFHLAASPLYLDFLCGRRTLRCAAWANPTYNVRGWRGPCYLVADRHHATYRELLETTDWDGLGPGRDPRCEHCLMHCGFEPAAVFSAWGLRDAVRMAVWQMT